MTYTTLDNWKAQVTAKGIEPNVAMRLIQDAQAQIDALRSELKHARANKGIDHMVSAITRLVDERDALRAALQRLVDASESAANADDYTGSLYRLHQAESNARRVLGEITP